MISVPFLEHCPYFSAVFVIFFTLKCPSFLKEKSFRLSLWSLFSGINIIPLAYFFSIIFYNFLFFKTAVKIYFFLLFEKST